MVIRPPHKMVLDNQSKTFDKHNLIETESTELLKYAPKANLKEKSLFEKVEKKNVEDPPISLPISNHY